MGLLTGILYGLNVNAVLQDINSINLGTVYESVVAQELAAHGFKLHYYDNKQRGEVDFLIDDYNALSVLPLEIKSGKDYTEHSALSKFVATPEEKIAKENNIKHQVSARTLAVGGTNAVVLQQTKDGIMTISLGIPCRYMHTPVELCDLDDIESAIELLYLIITKINSEILIK